MTKAFSILVADELSAEGLDILREHGEVTVRKGMNEDQLRETLPPFHALVVRSATKVTARALEQADNLAVIGRAGIGIDNIDVGAATACGVVVMNTPDAGAVTTGELAVSLMMSLARRIPAADQSIREGRWEKSKLIGTELRGKTLGVLGLGRIGSVVAQRGVGLSMEVIGHDPAVSQNDAPKGVRIVELEELLRTADFVSVHVPLLDSTRHLLNEERLSWMKPTAHLIHAARGGIVDERALCDALDNDRLAGAALDVFETEPLPSDHQLLKTRNVVLTPHLGASTKEAKRGVSLDIASQVGICLTKGIALNGVNVPRIAPSEAAILSPYLNLVHNLSSFISQVFEGELVSLRLTLQGALPESAQRPLTVAMQVGALRPRQKIPVTPVNVERVAKDVGVRVHSEASSMKRDFMNLVRVEALIDGQRHSVSGTVLGHRHGRMVEFDEFLLDAIPEGPLLVTFHDDVPGVLGLVGTILGEENINISRMQLGNPPNGNGPALGIWNLEEPLTERAMTRIRKQDPIRRSCMVR